MGKRRKPLAKRRRSWYTHDMSNAIEFISAYNAIDSRLRAIYRGKGNLQFSDLVRRCAEFNKTVRRYEDDLLLCARLRNVIVHESNKERIIAEPCDDLTELIVHVAELLNSPPKLSALRDKNVTGIDADATLSDAVVRIAQTNYSNLPVYRNGRMIGVLNNRRVVRVMGQALERERSLEELLQTPCADVLREEDLYRFYKVLGKKDTVQEAIDAFEENRKLLAVLVTESGYVGDTIVNLITSADLPQLIRMLEE